MERIVDQSRGFIATSLFSPGDLILEERAILSIELGDSEIEEDVIQGLSKELDKKLALLSELENQQFLQMEDNFAQDEKKTTLGITMTNALRLPGNKLAIFTTISLITNDCLPNAVAVHVTQLNETKIILRAVRQISTGAEITISLLNTGPVTSRSDIMTLFATSADRKQMLQTRHGFVCDCLSCVEGRGDNERSRIVQLEFYGDYTDIEQCKEQLQLCKDIDMHPGILLLVSLKIIMALYLKGDTIGMKLICDEAKHYATVAEQVVGESHAKILKSILLSSSCINKLRTILMTFNWEPDLIDISDTGKYVVTNFPFSPGEIILEESPIFSIAFDQAPSMDDLAAEVIDPLIEKCIHALSSSDKEDLIKLDSSPNQGSSFVSIVKSNAYIADNNLKLFFKLSRIRHSCMPNSKATWWNGNVIVRAMEPIERGEEVTISYIESSAALLFSATEERKSVLEKHFSFSCRCKCCACDQFDVTRSNFTCIRNAPSLKQNCDQYHLSKKVGMHSGVLHQSTFNYIVSLFIQTRDQNGLVAELCNELQEYASITFGNDSPIVLEIGKMKDFIDFENINKVNAMMKAQSVHPFALNMAESEHGFEIVEIPGEGMGLVARRNFSPGESILVESPLLTLSIHPDFNDNDSIKRLMDPELNLVLTELSGKKRREFYQLSDTVLHEKKRSPFGIVKTNAFNISAGEMAMFALICRMNHSCMANVHYYQLSKNTKNCHRRMRLRAVRPIEAGEQMYVSYVGGIPHNSFDTADARQRKMEEHFNFICKCSACLDKLDDEKRRRIADISTAEFIEEQYKLCKEIGLHAGVLLTVALECIVQLNQQEGRMSSIKEVCSEAKEYAKIGFGTDLRVVTICLDKVEKAVNETELKEPIETIEKILDRFNDLDL